MAHGPSGRNRYCVSPDDLPFDLARIGEVLEHHAVRYVVIGGMSGTFHGMVDYRTRTSTCWCWRTPAISTGSQRR